MARNARLITTMILGAAALTGCTRWQARPPAQKHDNYADDLKYRLDQSTTQVTDLRREQAALADKARQFETQARTQSEIQALLEQRVDNLRRENDRLAGEIAANMLASTGERPGGGSGGGNILKAGGTAMPTGDLPQELRKKLAQFASDHDGVTFVPDDPPLLRFQAHQTFVDASDRFTSNGKVALRDLGKLMNSRSMKDWDYMVVGHTFSESQVTNELVALHATDWHLAAHQAIASILFLEEQGVPPSRFSVLSYGSQQPLEKGDDDVTRRRNARIEVYFVNSKRK